MRGCPDPNFRIEPVLRAVDAEVVLRAFDDIFEPNLSAQVGDLAAYAEKLENCGRLLVARRCDSRELLGFIAFYANDTVGGAAYISLLAVSPEHRGFGLGSQLLSASCEEAVKAGMRTIALQVRDENLHALDLYRSHGFDRRTSIDKVSHLREKDLRGYLDSCS